MNPKSEKVSEAIQKLRQLDKDTVWTPEPQTLLHPNIPKPLHGVAPRVIMGAAWWSKTRKKAYQSTRYHCIACRVHKTRAKSKRHLEAHECYNVDYLLGRMTYIKTVPLCNYCHSFIHSGRLAASMAEGTIHQAKYVAVIQHGQGVLRRAKLPMPEDYPGPFADWEDWRLIFEDKEYPPKFKSFAQWKAAFS